MKKRQIVSLMMILFWMVTVGVIDLAAASPESLTTTLVVIVKANPESNLLPSDKNGPTVKELAREQTITQPYIKHDVSPSGEEVYTICDKL